MVQVIQADKVTLYYLEKKFKLQLAEDNEFFGEWRQDLPALADAEKQQLDRVKASYFNLIKRPMLEDMVKMVVLSPLLSLSEFYLPPFYSKSEESVEIISEDGDVVIRGRIDILVLQDELWVVVIESKRAGYSLEVGIPQALAYMLANPQPNKPLFGLVTNGSNFIFLKLIQQDFPLYALSDEFTLRRGNDLYTVLSVLKRLGQLISQDESDDRL